MGRMSVDEAKKFEEREEKRKTNKRKHKFMKFVKG